MLALVVVVVSVDVLFFRNRLWERLMVNVGVVLVFAAFYLRFLKRPLAQPATNPIARDLDKERLWPPRGAQKFVGADRPELPSMQPWSLHSGFAANGSRKGTTAPEPYLCLRASSGAREAERPHVTRNRGGNVVPRRGIGIMRGGSALKLLNMTQ